MGSFQFGCEVIKESASLMAALKGRKLAFLGHPASVDQNLAFTLDELVKSGLKFSSAFGPQHGMRGEKQDNMIESEDFLDPVHQIPVFSLYGKVRRPSEEMMSSFDVILIDLQDVGCRIYTFLTTLFYVLDEAAKFNKSVWVLDRPNPAGRAVEGQLLSMKFESFVGAAPVPMRHGLTLGEAALWYKDHKKLDVDLKIVEMKNYHPNDSGSWGWPKNLSWVNPSPNMPRLSCVRQYPGSVLVEGTHISEGRGTTIPLEVLGFPGMKSQDVIQRIEKAAPDWLRGARLRACFFEPTFHKFKTQLVSAIQVHVDGPWFDYENFKPYRLYCGLFKAIHEVHPEFTIWKGPPYEYEEKLKPIDILSGDQQLREWTENPKASFSDLEKVLKKDEEAWKSSTDGYHLYK